MKAYRADWQAFTTWCKANGLETLPAAAETVAAYLTDRRHELSVTTLARHVASISQAHKWYPVQPQPNPTDTELVRAVMQGLRATANQRTRDSRKGKAPALTADQMRQLLAPIGDDLAGLRDKALLLIGYKAALRRSELASVTWQQIEWLPEGIVLHLHGAKTDHDYLGQAVALRYEQSDYCPITALKHWRIACAQQIEVDTGAVFRSVNKHLQLGATLTAHSIGAIVSARAAEVGLHGVTAHSLRRGHITEGHKQGRTEADLMRTSRHKSVAVFRGYIDDADLMSRATGAGLL
jgi:integrase